jgi:hypothetical protein
MLDSQRPKPKQTELIQDPPFVGDAVGHDPVEGADAIGANNQKSVT